MQLEFFDVPSPCVGICQADEKGYCLGCLRTRDERQTWKDFSNDDKQKVIKRCMQRKKRKAKRIEQEQTSNSKEEQIISKSLDENLTENLQQSLLVPENKTTAKQNNDMDFGDFEL